MTTLRRLLRIFYDHPCNCAGKYEFCRTCGSRCHC